MKTKFLLFLIIMLNIHCQDNYHGTAILLIMTKDSIVVACDSGLKNVGGSLVPEECETSLLYQNSDTSNISQNYNNNSLLEETIDNANNLILPDYNLPFLGRLYSKKYYGGVPIPQKYHKIGVINGVGYAVAGLLIHSHKDYFGIAYHYYDVLDVVKETCEIEGNIYAKINFFKKKIKGFWKEIYSDFSYDQLFSRDLKSQVAFYCFQENTPVLYMFYIQPKIPFIQQYGVWNRMCEADVSCDSVKGNLDSIHTYPLGIPYYHRKSINNLNLLKDEMLIEKAKEYIQFYIENYPSGCAPPIEVIVVDKEGFYQK